MKIEKTILARGQKAILTYNDNMFDKYPNILNIFDEYLNPLDMYTEASIILQDTGVQIKLYINGEGYYDNSNNYVLDFYFKVVDFDRFGNKLSYSEPIYETFKNEVELLQLMVSNSYYLNNENDFKICEKGFIAGYCDDETSRKCEYSALGMYGLCGAECQDCFGEMFALKEDKAYVCDCSKILFEDRHVGIRELS